MNAHHMISLAVQILLYTLLLVGSRYFLASSMEVYANGLGLSQDLPVFIGHLKPTEGMHS